MKIFIPAQITSVILFICVFVCCPAMGQPMDNLFNQGGSGNNPGQKKDDIDLLRNLMGGNSEKSAVLSKWIVFSGNENQSKDPKVNFSKQSGEKTVFTLTVPGVTKKSFSRHRENWDSLDLSGFAKLIDPGKPEIPIKRIFVEIAADSKPEIHILSGKTVTMKDINLYPAQPSPNDLAFAEDNGQPFSKDLDVYSKDAFFPKSHIVATEIITIRDKTFLNVTVTPFRYNPVSRVMEVTHEMEIEVTTSAAKGDNDASLFTPDKSQDDYYNKDISSELAVIFKADSDLQPERYMILLDDQFKDNSILAEFVEWKMRKGYEVIQILTSAIPAKKKGAPDHQELVNYMRSLKGRDYPLYLLIIGDETRENGVQGFKFDTYSERRGEDLVSYSDLYLANQSDKDYFPDLYYGRLPAENNEQLTIMLQKVLAMDRNPPVSGVYDRAIVTGQIQNYNCIKEGDHREHVCKTDNRADRLFCETADLIFSYMQNSVSRKDGIKSLVVNPQKVQADYYWNSHSLLWNTESKITSRVTDNFLSVEIAREKLALAVNEGVSLVQHRDHGIYFGWGDPKFFVDDVNKLKNGSKTPLVFSINCQTGAYNKGVKNFTMGWLLNRDGGAHAVIAPVNISFSWHNDWMVHGMYRAVFPDYIDFQNNSASPEWSKKILPGTLAPTPGSAQRLGQMVNDAFAYYKEFGRLESQRNFIPKTVKTYGHATFLLYHLFGDPETFFHFHKPQEMKVRHPQIINTGQELKIDAEKGAMVSLYAPAPMSFHQVQICENDTVRFSVPKEKSGTVYVTVTRYERLPYEGKITITDNSSPDRKGEINSDGLQQQLDNIL